MKIVRDSNEENGNCAVANCDINKGEIITTYTAPLYWKQNFRDENFPKSHAFQYDSYVYDGYEIAMGIRNVAEKAGINWSTQRQINIKNRMIIPFTDEQYKNEFGHDDLFRLAKNAGLGFMIQCAPNASLANVLYVKKDPPNGVGVGIIKIIAKRKIAQNEILLGWYNSYECRFGYGVNSLLGHHIALAGGDKIALEKLVMERVNERDYYKKQLQYFQNRQPSLYLMLLRLHEQEKKRIKYLNEVLKIDGYLHPEIITIDNRDPESKDFVKSFQNVYLEPSEIFPALIDVKTKKSIRKGGIIGYFNGEIVAREIYNEQTFICETTIDVIGDEKKGIPDFTIYVDPQSFPAIVNDYRNSNRSPNCEIYVNPQAFGRIRKNENGK